MTPGGAGQQPGFGARTGTQLAASQSFQPPQRDAPRSQRPPELTRRSSESGGGREAKAVGGRTSEGRPVCRRYPSGLQGAPQSSSECWSECLRHVGDGADGTTLGAQRGPAESAPLTPGPARAWQPQPPPPAGSRRRLLAGRKGAGRRRPPEQRARRTAKV